MNYIDVYIRKGLYRMIEPPAPIGMEAAGVVLESNAAGFRPGDRVAYAAPQPGAYATVRDDAGGLAGAAARVAATSRRRRR